MKDMARFSICSRIRTFPRGVGVMRQMLRCSKISQQLLFLNQRSILAQSHKACSLPLLFRALLPSMSIPSPEEVCLSQFRLILKFQCDPLRPAPNVGESYSRSFNRFGNASSRLNRKRDMVKSSPSNSNPLPCLSTRLLLQQPTRLVTEMPHSSSFTAMIRNRRTGMVMGPPSLTTPSF